MIRVLVSLWGALSLVAVDREVAATSPTGESGASPAVNCEQPTTSPAVPAPKSEADLAWMMTKWLAEREAHSQMEAWWGQRTEVRDPMTDKPAPTVMTKAISQMDTWWRERNELARPAARKPVPPAQYHRRHHREYSVSPTEFGCPPSICSN
jgi:hypothetical protein